MSMTIAQVIGQKEMGPKKFRLKTNLCPQCT